MSGCSEALRTEGTPRVERVEPPGAYNGFDVPLVIFGDGFFAKATQQIGDGSVAIDSAYQVWLGRVALRDVAYVDTRTLRAVVPAGIAPGTYALAVENPYGETATLPSAYVVSDRRDAALTAVLIADPATPTTGTQTSVTLRVSNLGERTARGVTPVELLFATPGILGTLSGPSPAEADIPSGTSVEFVWICDATSVGSTEVFASASGTDELTEYAVDTGSIGPAAVEVLALAELSAALSVSPPRVSAGQTVDVVLNVAAGPGVGANDVVAALAVTAGSVDLQAGPTPASAAIEGGTVQQFAWRYSTAAAGAVAFSGSASGSDANSGVPVSTGTVDSNPVVVERPANLSALFALFGPVNAGQTFVVQLVVQNDGEAAALAVSPPQLLDLSGSAAATWLSGPEPLTADVAGGSNATFFWRYRADVAGDVTFSTDVAGSDANSGVTVYTGLVTSTPLVVETPADLSATWVVPAAVNEGQTFEVRFVVQNSAQATALGVSPQQLSVLGTAGITPVSGPLPTSADIAGSSAQEFVWTLTAGSAGWIELATSASGTDANSSQTVSTGSVSSTQIAIERPATLTCASAIPATITRSTTFTVRMTVPNSGGAGADSVTPSSLSVGGSAAVSLLSGPTPASADIAGGGSATFDWIFSADAVGTVDFTGAAQGTDSVDGAAVSCTPASSNTATIDEVSQVFNDPLGDGTSFSFVFPYRGQIVVGPRANGTGAVRANPDGTGAEPLTFVFSKDTTGNQSTNSWAGAPPYPSMGYSGCASNTDQCGPDNENGRGLFASGSMAGSEWLVIAGSRSSGDLEYVYLAADIDAQLDFTFVDLSAFLGANTRGTSAMRVFNERLYLGFPDTGGARPYLVVVKVAPTPPGLDATSAEAENLQADNMPGIGDNPASMRMIDWLWEFNGRLYVVNNGGCMRSTTTTPRAYDAFPSDWQVCTPNAAAYGAKTSVTTTKVANIEPADKAIPQMASFGGRLYMARNTTLGPQLWVCDASLGGAPDQCEPADWALAAANSAGDLQLSQFNNANNTQVSLLAATAQHLYIGFDNATDAMTLFRSITAVPATRDDFEGRDGCVAANHPVSCQGLGGPGLGAASNTRIFDAVAATFNTRDYLYVVTGDGSSAARVYRLSE